MAAPWYCACAGVRVLAGTTAGSCSAPSLYSGSPSLDFHDATPPIIFTSPASRCPLLSPCSSALPARRLLSLGSRKHAAPVHRGRTTIQCTRARASSGGNTSLTAQNKEFRSLVVEIEGRLASRYRGRGRCVRQRWCQSHSLAGRAPVECASRSSSLFPSSLPSSASSDVVSPETSFSKKLSASPELNSPTPSQPSSRTPSRLPSSFPLFFSSLWSRWKGRSTGPSLERLDQSRVTLAVLEGVRRAGEQNDTCRVTLHTYVNEADGRTHVEVRARSHAALTVGDPLCLEAPLLVGTSRGLHLSRVFEIPSLSRPPGGPSSGHLRYPRRDLSGTPFSLETNTSSSAAGSPDSVQGVTAPAVSPFLDLLAAAILARYPDCVVSSSVVCPSSSSEVANASSPASSRLPHCSDSSSSPSTSTSRFHSKEGSVLETLEQLAVCQGADTNFVRTFSSERGFGQSQGPAMQGIDLLHGALLPPFKERLSKNDLHSLFLLVHLGALPLPAADDRSTEGDFYVTHPRVPLGDQARGKSNSTTGGITPRSSMATLAGSRAPSSVARTGFFPLLLAFAGNPSCCPNTSASFLHTESGPQVLYVLLKPVSPQLSDSNSGTPSEQGSPPAPADVKAAGADNGEWMRSTGSEVTTAVDPRSPGEHTCTTGVSSTLPRLLHISPATSLETLYLPTYMRQAALRRRSFGLAASECTCPRCTQLPDLCRAFYCLSCRSRAGRTMVGRLAEGKQEQEGNRESAGAEAHPGYVHRERAFRPCVPPGAEADAAGGLEASPPTIPTGGEPGGFQVKWGTGGGGIDSVVYPTGPSRSLSLMETPMRCQVCGEEPSSETKRRYEAAERSLFMALATASQMSPEARRRLPSYAFDVLADAAVGSKAEDRSLVADTHFLRVRQFMRDLHHLARCRQQQAVAAQNGAFAAAGAEKPDLLRRRCEAVIEATRAAIGPHPDEVRLLELLAVATGDDADFRRAFERRQVFCNPTETMQSVSYDEWRRKLLDVRYKD